MADYGYWKFSRKFTQTDPFWSEPRVFSRAEAWIDMIDMAAYRDRTITRDGHLIHLKRGEVSVSVRFLSRRWQWTVKRVRVFIEALFELERIELVRTEQAGAIYRLTNYERYQDGPESTPDATPETDENKGTPGAHLGVRQWAQQGAQPTNGATTLLGGPGAHQGAGAGAHPDDDLGHKVEVKEETTTTTTARESADEQAAALAEMKADANRTAQQIEAGARRNDFNGSIRGIVEGDDYTAWQDATGSQIPWSDRPRLLRLAFDHFLAGNARGVRSALRFFVVPTQLDPFDPQRSADRPAQSGTVTALPCSTGDIKALLRHAGPSIYMAAYRPTAFADLASNHPDLWARAGPYFRELDFGAIRQIEDKQKGFGLDRNIDEQLSRIAGRLDAA